MDHQSILELHHRLCIEREHVLFGQQYHMGCSYNQLMDMGLLVFYHQSNVSYHQLGKPQYLVQLVVTCNLVCMHMAYRDQLRMVSLRCSLSRFILYPLYLGQVFEYLSFLLIQYHMDCS